LQFEASAFENSTRGRWLRIEAGDFDADGDIDIILGSLVDIPDYVRPGLKAKWAAKSPSVLLLENNLRH